MTVISLKFRSESDQTAVREQLERILHSAPFLQSQRRQRFLEYIVNETLAGRGERLKGYNIALAVFDRPQNFDPAVDPIVRIEAARLRDKLREYYDTEGQSDAVRIDLPKGATRRGSSSARRYRNCRTWRRQVRHTSRRLRHCLGGSVARDGKSRCQLGGDRGARRGRSVARTRSSGTANPRRAHSGPRPGNCRAPLRQSERRWEAGLFSDGLTEDILTDALAGTGYSRASRVTPPSSNTRASRSTWASLGASSRARYVLEGSIQPSDGRLRVTAQLIDTETGGHIWADRYDRADGRHFPGSGARS